MPNGPLEALSQKLRSLGVSSLSTLIAWLKEAEEYEAFVALIKEFLPERERDILTQPSPQTQIAEFASYFEDRYFPLDDIFKMGDIDGYSDLTRGIPVIPRGLSYDDYHYAATESWRPGLQLMTYLVETPYDDDARIALAEACEEYVPRELLEHVHRGFNPGFLCCALNDTPYKALAKWAEIIWHDSGNFFLDIDYEELWNEGLPFWDKAEIEWLTQDWQQADVIEQEILKLAEWLEQDPPSRFEELIKFILERR